MGLCPLIIPVSLFSAEQWLLGRKADRDLFLKAAHKPEVVFIAALPDRRSYRPLCEALLYWKRKGAAAVICRTGTPVVASHLISLGAITGAVEHGEVTHQEDGFDYADSYKLRYFVPASGFALWAARIEKTTS